MKKFLINTAIFAAIILVILAAGEIVVRNLPNSYSYKHRYIKEHGESVATLVLGSSHTYYGIKSDELGDSVFNLANVSQTPDLDLALLSQYIGDLKNLRRVIMPISYFTFVDLRLEETPEWFRCIQYKKSMHLPIHSDFSKYNFEISDFEGYSAKLKGLVLKDASNKCDSLGFGLGYTTKGRSKDWESFGKERADMTTIPLTAHADEVEKWLGDLIRFCRERDIECVLITTPAWHTYRENLDSVQFADMKARTTRLAKNYGLPYYDFFADPDFGTQDFHDVDHLSDVGASKLTAKLRHLLGL